jgi:hypothetical protein
MAISTADKVSRRLQVRLGLREWPIIVKERWVCPVASVPPNVMVTGSYSTTPFNPTGVPACISILSFTIQAAIVRIVGKFHAAFASNAV